MELQVSEKRMLSTVSEIEYRSTLGTAFQVGGDSAAEYLLHPVFLQFAVLSLSILAVMDHGGAMAQPIGWQALLIWLAMAVTGLVGGIGLMALLAALPRGMVGRRRFTPLILLPLVALAELVRAALTLALQAGDWPQMPELMADFARSAIIVLILDVMHALYVVPLHPLANAGTAERPTPAEASAEDAAPPEQPPTEAPRHPAPEIVIAERRFGIDEILWIRTEDHYLNVVTARGRSLLRAKLSDLQALQDGTIGMQVNRSQWVAFAAIAEVLEETGGQVTLRLSTGDDASVARSRRIMFRQMRQAWRQRLEG